MYAVLFDVKQVKGEPGRAGTRVHWADVPEAEFARAWFENDLVLAVGGSQLPCDLLRTIRTVVVDDDHLPSEVTTLFQNHTSAGPARVRAPCRYARAWRSLSQKKR